MSEVAIRPERSSHGAVGAALGILMGRHGINVADAFALLVRSSRRSGIDLRDLASGLVHASRRAERSGPRSYRLDRPATTAARRSGACAAINSAPPDRWS